MELGGLKSSGRGDQLKIAGSFIKLDEQFKHYNSSFLQLNDQFDSLTLNLTTALSPLSPALKNLEQKVEHLRALDKSDIMKAISDIGHRETNLDNHPMLKHQFDVLKKELQTTLSDEFQRHKNVIKQVIDSESQETQEWREDIKTHLSKLSEKIDKQPERVTPSPPQQDKLDHIFQLLDVMNRNGARDRDMIMQEIKTLKTRDVMPLHSTPLENFPRFHTPLHHQQNRQSPLPHQSQMDPLDVPPHLPRVVEEDNIPPVHLQSRPGSFRAHGVEFLPDVTQTTRRPFSKIGRMTLLKQQCLNN